MPKSKSMCSGCYNNFYNMSGVGCWSFAKAKIVKRVRVGTWEPPPYSKSRAEKCLDCYRPEGCSMLELTDTRVVSDVKATRDRWDKESRERQARKESHVRG